MGITDTKRNYQTPDDYEEVKRREALEIERRADAWVLLAVWDHSNETEH